MSRSTDPIALRAAAESYLDPYLEETLGAARAIAAIEAEGS